MADYMLGVMEPGAAQEFERSLLDCESHVALAREYTQVIGWLGASVRPAEPPQGHKLRLMSRVAATPQEPSTLATQSPADASPVPAMRVETNAARVVAAPVVDLGAYREKKRRAFPLMPALATVAAVLALFFGWWGWSAQTALHIPDGYVAVPVRGQAAAKGASAVVLINPRTNEASLLANGLTPLPAGKVYEMWLLSPDPKAPPVAAGVFNSDSAGLARHQVSAPQKMGDYAGVAVTVERAPGVATAEGPMVLVGKYALP